MKVRAKAHGIYGRMREPGEIFDVSDELIQVKDGEGNPAKDEHGQLIKKQHFTPTWMERVNDEGKPIAHTPGRMIPHQDKEKS